VFEVKKSANFKSHLRKRMSKIARLACRNPISMIRSRRRQLWLASRQLSFLWGLEDDTWNSAWCNCDRGTCVRGSCVLETLPLDLYWSLSYLYCKAQSQLPCIQHSLSQLPSQNFNLGSSFRSFPLFHQHLRSCMPPCF